MNILELENLSIGFKNIIFKNINAEVLPGSLIALMGVNGVGKSCLLKTIANLIPIKEGNIKLDQKLINEYGQQELAAVRAVVLTEKFHVDFLRVDELVSLGRSPFTPWQGKLSRADQKIVQDSLKALGVFDLSTSYFSELSDGQKQKVLIARALAQKPKLLILDEPTTYLDIPSKRELIKLLKKIAEENSIAILLSTHDLDLIEKIADQIWIMGKSGEFIQETPINLRSTGVFDFHF